MATQAFSSMMAFIKGFFSNLLASHTPAILAQFPQPDGLVKLRARMLFLLRDLEQPFCWMHKLHKPELAFKYFYIDSFC